MGLPQMNNVGMHGIASGGRGRDRMLSRAPLGQKMLAMYLKLGLRTHEKEDQ